MERSNTYLQVLPKWKLDQREWDLKKQAERELFILQKISALALAIDANYWCKDDKSHTRVYLYLCDKIHPPIPDQNQKLTFKPNLNTQSSGDQTQLSHVPHIACKRTYTHTHTHNGQEFEMRHVQKHTSASETSYAAGTAEQDRKEVGEQKHNP